MATEGPKVSKRLRDAISHMDLKHAVDVTIKGRVEGRKRKGRKKSDGKLVPNLDPRDESPMSTLKYSSNTARSKGYVGYLENE